MPNWYDAPLDGPDDQNKLDDADEFGFGPAGGTTESPTAPESSTPADAEPDRWSAPEGDSYEAPTAPTGFDGTEVPPPPPPPPPPDPDFGFGPTATDIGSQPSDDGGAVEEERDATGGPGGTTNEGGAEPDTTGTGDGSAWGDGDGQTSHRKGEWVEGGSMWQRPVHYQGQVGYFPDPGTVPVTADTEIPAEMWWMKLEDPNQGGWYSLNPDGTYNYHSGGAQVINATGPQQGLQQRFNTTLLKARAQFGDGVSGHAPMMEAMGLDPELSPRAFNEMLQGPEGEALYRNLLELSEGYDGVEVEGEDDEMGFPTREPGDDGNIDEDGEDGDGPINPEDDPNRPGGPGNPEDEETIPGGDDGGGDGEDGGGDGEDEGDPNGGGTVVTPPGDGGDPISEGTDEWADRMRQYADDSMNNPSRWNADLVQQGMDVINASLDKMRQKGGTSLSERFASRGLQGSSLEGQSFVDFEGELARQGQEQSWNMAREMANTFGEDRDRAWGQGRGVMNDQFAMDQMIADESFRNRMLALQERGMDEQTAFREAEMEWRKEQFGMEFGEGQRRWDQGFGLDRDRFKESQRKNTMDFLAWVWGLDVDSPEFEDYIAQFFGQDNNAGG